jgi:phosphomannomutase
LRGRDTIVRKIIETGSDLGVCFDGDADRAIFFDENGEFISPDMITALLGNYFLDSGIGTSERSDGDTVFYDIRSSNSVKEYIGRHGGKSVACRTGHSHIKKLMREGKGIFAGELSGHYYFRDNYNCDSGFIAFLTVLSVLSMQKRSFKEIVESVNPYYFSGEINFLIDDLDPILRKIKTRYSDGKVTEIDGIRLDFDDWWFILRFSTAEPVLRLVVEATSSQGMAAKIAELSGIILSENGRRI